MLPFPLNYFVHFTPLQQQYKPWDSRAVLFIFLHQNLLHSWDPATQSLFVCMKDVEFSLWPYHQVTLVYEL